MITQGRVVAVSGEYATVEVDRKSACEGCHKNTGADGCVVCAIGGNQKITLRARNIADAATDIVISAPKPDACWICAAGIYYAAADSRCRILAWHRVSASIPPGTGRLE